MSQHDFLAKLLIIGNSGVGKTNILLKFTANTFVMSHITTIGIDFKSKTILVDGKKIRLQIWDTAGQQRFRTITQTYYKGAQGIILAYAIDDQASFYSLETWLKQIKQHAPQDIMIFVIGTKCDLSQQRKVSTSQGEQFAKKQGLSFFQVSAKNNINIENLFEQIGKQVKQKIEKREEQDKFIKQKRQKLHAGQSWKDSELKPLRNKQCKC